MFSKFKKLSVSLLLLIFIGVSCFGSLALPQPAKAQFAVTEIASVPQTVKMILEKVWEGLKIGVLNVAGTTVSYALRKIAYDSAVWIASGGKGQSALIFNKGFSSYIKNVGDDAIGHGIDELSSQFGYNLCKIPNPKIDLAMRESIRLGIGLGTNTKDPTRKPSCSLTQFYQNNLSADAWTSRYSGFVKSAESQFNQALTFDISQGDLGIQMDAAEKILAKIAQAQDAAKVDVLKAGGIKDLTDKVSGDIMIPGKEVEKEIEGNADRVEKATKQVDNVFSSGQFQLMPGALATFFLNTLAGTMLKNFQEKGILPFGLGCQDGTTACEGGDAALNYDSTGVGGGRRLAQQFFNDFLSARITAVDEYNILGQLNNCPENPGLYNCRADDKLIQAAQEFNNGNPLTINEAIQKGFLDGNKKLIPPIRVAENANRDCYKDSFCHSNVKVLRQLRILPLGFEIATEKSDPDRPWTLKQVVDGFTNCDYIRNNGQITGVRYNPIKYPFCHLVDPNWVIKAPATRCNAYVYGSTLLSKEVPDRQQDCADLSTCVTYNKDGSCANYGYCTREQNTWKFNADQCDAQYRTCKSFTDESGASKSYLYRTLDTGSCTKDNVGCQTYSFSQNDAGEWLTPQTNNPLTNTTNGIYFNAKVSTTCGTNSAGCSAYKVASSTDNLLYLRKAPDYSQCYDTNLATKAIDWPKTVADLSKLKPKKECSNYASACLPEEVSCSWYTPVLASQNKIPGRFTADDVCDQKCVGYAAYREMPSNYSLGQSVEYVIPSSGNVCAAQDEGCSGFTNLGTTSGGVEKVEYFSYMRSCSLPDKDRQKNFVTYEGSALGGFQLKTFTLIKDTAGGPQYFYRTPDDARQYDAICSESLYKSGQASLDCRQFNDEQGKVYYRLLSKTIPVSDTCTPYRLNNDELYPVTATQAECAAQKGYWNNNQCQVCFQGGEYRDGSCFYFGLPGGIDTTAGSSKSCTAAANSCRAFKGNNGNNIKEIVSDNFESTTNALGSWSGNGVSVSTESTRVGEHSLGYVGAGEVYRTLTLVPGKTYDLTFWAKGSGQNLNISLRSTDGKLSKQFSSFGVGDVWNYYHVGPIELDGSSGDVQLVFKNQVNGKLFVDNLNITEMSDNIYLVKNSLNVDPVCDSNLDDNLPGESLGCTAYKDSSNQVFNLTGFTQLCREGAIGCTALFDTQNTINDEGPRSYNVWLPGASNTKVEMKVGDDTVSCQILAGNNGCFTNVFGHEAQEILAVNRAAFTSSTVYIPSDTASTSPVYLVANQAATCNSVDLGCSFAGTETLSVTGKKYSTVIVKNDPSTYENTLCQQDAVGCKAYAGSGGQSYFKDPLIAGQKVCAYRSGVSVNNSSFDGWFWKGVGVCSNNSQTSCSSNQDCGTGNTCTRVNDIPCYPNYLVEDSSYGLWSYGDKGKYRNYVGECPAEQDQCTEFKDPNDAGRPYYFIKNEKMSQGSCDGSVSQKEGCALFDQTDNPNKYWVSADSYKASEAAQYKLVKPVEASTNNPGDANTILKVQMDRQCGEWLQCRSSHRVWDQQNGKWKNVCDAVGRCIRAPENPQEDNLSNCAEWADDGPVERAKILDQQTYAERDIGWKGMDYSGYSLLGIFPVETLSQINVNPVNSEPDWRLGYLVPCADTNCAVNAGPEDYNCKVSGNACGKSGEGICVNGSCTLNINGQSKDYNLNSPTQICRAYPEKDSPFPNSTSIDKAKSQFQGANLCNETTLPSSDSKISQKCECDYTKVSYGEALTKYWNYSKPHTTEEVIKGAKEKVPEGICLGGSRDGAACDSDSQCYKTGTGKPDGNKLTNAADGTPIVDGSCMKQKRKTKLLGWRGFCLEKDMSRNVNGEETNHPCLTWFPVDYLTGTQDIDNQHTEAGYQPPATTGGVGGALYCLVGSSAGRGTPKGIYPDGTTFIARGATSTISIDTGRDGNSAQFARKSYDATREEGNFSQLDIESIELTVRDPDSEDPQSNTVFKIWPNDQVTGKDKPQASYRVITDNHSNEYGVAVTGKYLGQDNQLILMYGSRVEDATGETNGPWYVNKEGKVCYPSVRDKPAGQLGADLDETQCQDLNGNVFEKLYSKKQGGNSGVLMNENDGIWDNSFTPDEVCHGYKGNQGNWHALRIKFDKNDKKFLGYDMAYCDQSSTGGQIAYEVKFNLREWCSTIADVTNDPTSVTLGTAPWTNRLWPGAKPQYELRDEQDARFGGYKGLNYKLNYDSSPFASLGLNILTRPFDPLVLTEFEQVKTDYCQPGLRAGVFGCEISKAISDPVKDVSSDDFRASVSGGPFSCPGGQCVRVDNARKMYPSDAAGYDGILAGAFLNQLFARVNEVVSFDYTIDPNTGKYKGYVKPQPFLDQTETVNPIPKVPWIFPAVNCDNDGKCLEDNTAPGFSINNIYNRDVRIPSPSARVFLRFFAFADADQMPLRSIKVDWDEEIGKDAEGKPGLYRNHRGDHDSKCVFDANGRNGQCQVQQIDDSKPCRDNTACGVGGRCIFTATGSNIGKCLVTKNTHSCIAQDDCERISTCVDSNKATSFGFQLDRTCDNNFIQYTHVYQCSKFSPQYTDKTTDCDGKDANGTAFPRGCCIFVPRVQVKDNWGWYNGRCTGNNGNPGGDGCYDGSKIGKDDEGEIRGGGAWTNFGGKIVLSPPLR